MAMITLPGVTPLGVGAASIAAGAITEAKLDPATNNVLNAGRWARYLYDFSTLGGAVSTIALTGAALPAKAIVIGGIMRVLTAITGGAGTTAGVDLEAASDIILATIVAGAPWSTTGRKAIIPVFTAATAVETTQARTPTITVGVNPITAGKFNLFLQYVITD